MAEHFFYTSAEAAAYLGLTTGTLAVYRCHNTGPRFVKIGERGKDAIAYRRPDLDDWARKRRRNKREAARLRERNRTRQRLAGGER